MKSCTVYKPTSSVPSASKVPEMAGPCLCVPTPFSVPSVPSTFSVSNTLQMVELPVSNTLQIVEPPVSNTLRMVGPPVSNIVPTHPQVSLKILDTTGGKNPLPSYGTSLSSGFDLIAYLEESVTILPGERKLISSGIKVSIPMGYELQVRSRSGLAYKNGISVLNSPGTIDADFSGQIGIILMNSSTTEFVVSNGMRIAQAVLCPIVQASFIVCSSEEDLGETVRGQGGFGSTGV